MFPVLHIGSVKNILGVEGEAPYLFHFSDRFSVFDWGSMPDELETKGTALAVMADFFFRQMQGAETWQQLDLPADLKATETYRDFCANGLSSMRVFLVRAKDNSAKKRSYCWFCMSENKGLPPLKTKKWGA